ncbi:hypothetical protein JoomaDRAFT_2054 [Galbibacter orientalis DSM 19592]|uniref:Uncharacterized protein n=1 Tax=Galbibacter orientalis DSM 19592 TaxID=926559 RepID=I3C605_9FLAO|nr:hypothetical protein [Galbibacter orientalis]EIJ39048.1 hypothetical protein JoomaDRAFT_2054 [Galbibacter orientalis DSM 19592]
MRNILIIIFFLIFNLTFSQESLPFEDYHDSSNYLKIDKIDGYNNKTTESFEMFLNSDKTWNVKYFRYEADSIVCTKNIVIDTLNRLDEKLWLKILITNIQYLPDWEKIEYKLKYNTSIINLKDDIVIFSEQKVIVDGISFVIEIKTDHDKGIYNKIRYPDPSYFLPQFKSVDEIKSISDLLKIIHTNFEIF